MLTITPGSDASLHIFKGILINRRWWYKIEQEPILKNMFHNPKDHFLYLIWQKEDPSWLTAGNECTTKEVHKMFWFRFLFVQVNFQLILLMKRKWILCLFCSAYFLFGTENTDELLHSVLDTSGGMFKPLFVSGRWAVWFWCWCWQEHLVTPHLFEKKTN